MVSQGKTSFPGSLFSASLKSKEIEKRDPGNEVDSAVDIDGQGKLDKTPESVETRISWALVKLSPHMIEEVGGTDDDHA